MVEWLILRGRERALPMFFRLSQYFNYIIVDAEKATLQKYIALGGRSTLRVDSEIVALKLSLIN